jgi:hypothetical protein
MDDGPRHVNGNGDDLGWDRRATQQANSPGVHRSTMIQRVLQFEMSSVYVVMLKALQGPVPWDQATRAGSRRWFNDGLVEYSSSSDGTRRCG